VTEADSPDIVDIADQEGLERKGVKCWDGNVVRVLLYDLECSCLAESQWIVGLSFKRDIRVEKGPE